MAIKQTWSHINSGAMDIKRTAYYIHGLELMKLIFAVLDGVISQL